MYLVVTEFLPGFPLETSRHSSFLSFSFVFRSGFYWVLPGFIDRYRVSIDVRFYWVFT